MLHVDHVIEKLKYRLNRSQIWKHFKDIPCSVLVGMFISSKKRGSRTETGLGRPPFSAVKSVSFGSAAELKGMGVDGVDDSNIASDCS